MYDQSLKMLIYMTHKLPCSMRRQHLPHIQLPHTQAEFPSDRLACNNEFRTSWTSHNILLPISSQTKRGVKGERYASRGSLTQKTIDKVASRIRDSAELQKQNVSATGTYDDWNDLLSRTQQNAIAQGTSPFQIAR